VPFKRNHQITYDYAISEVNEYHGHLVINWKMMITLVKQFILIIFRGHCLAKDLTLVRYKTITKVVFFLLFEYLLNFDFFLQGYVYHHKISI